MNEPAFFTTIADMFASDEEYVNLAKRNGFTTRGEFWDWMAIEYGAFRSGTAKSKRYGYGDTAIKFPNKQRYVEFALTWL